jgi:lysophospholipase L1-like esterase
MLFFIGGVSVWRIPCLVAALALVSITGRAGNTAAIPSPRTSPTNWVARHSEILEQTRRHDIELVFLGDSITEGWRWDKGGAAVWNKYYANRHAANLGVGWDRTQHVLWRLQLGELDGIEPKVIVLLIGTNNCGNEDNGQPRNSVPEIVQGVTAIVDRVRTQSPRSKILLLGIFPRGQKDDPVRAQIKDVNSRLAKLDNGKTIKFLDVGPKLLQPDGSNSQEIMPDLLHPSEKGYQIWAEAMEPTLAEMLK